MAENTLYYGDNLDILRRYIPDESVDLVYLDSPFNSKADYNVLFAEHDGSRSAAQIKAFEDTWHWAAAAPTYYATVERGGKVSQALQAFRMLLGEADMLAYLSMMAPRLVELRRVLKSTGSLYLHCDPTASHYLKILLDAVFGNRCFQNEVIWSYRRWPSPSRHFQRMHDVILFYSASVDGPGTFTVEYEPNSESYVKRFKGKTQMLDPESGTRKITLEAESKGLPRRDVWELSIVAGYSKERLGYPTQKPEALLERIIQASSNPGDVVLDPFCGCGTATVVAHRLGRRWIGIDVTQLAITAIKNRLLDAFQEGVTRTYRVIGEPTTLSEAEALAAQNKYQFQYWALGLVHARPTEEKKGADKGIDGRLYFHDEANVTKQIILQVKGGHTDAKDVRDLVGTIEREKARIGVLISLRQPAGPMRDEAASAGMYTSPWDHKPYPRVQLLTIAELLDGAQIQPAWLRQTNITYQRGQRVSRELGYTQSSLLDGGEAAE